MKIFATTAVFILAANVAFAQKYSPEELLQQAINNKVCGDLLATSAQYSTTDPSKVAVTCSDATGFIPAIGLLGVAGGAAAAGAVLLGAAGGGSGGATPSTN